MRFAYFPGCSSESSSIEYDMSARAVCDKLGIELVEIPFNCCGTHLVEEYKECYWLALNARNLSLAEELGLDILTICSSCFYNTRKANMMIKDRLDYINGILSSIGRRYEGKVDVKHILGVLHDNIDVLVKKVVKLVEIVAAPYYGCLILRPEEIANFDDPEDPKKMEEILEIIGCKVFKSHMRTDCCGAPIMLVDRDTHLKMVGRLIKSYEGVDCIVTVCPLCHYALDVGQTYIGTNIPILHVTQIVGLALGIDLKELGLDKNITPTDNLLELVRGSKTASKNKL